MDRESEIVLRLVLEREKQGKNVDIRKLIHLIHRYYWDDFVNQREIITTRIFNLMEEGYLNLKAVQEPDGISWIAYHVTDRGEKHLTSDK